MSTQNQNSISWQAPEFRHYEKNAGWYITFAAIALLVTGFFIFEKDIFAAISTVLLAGIIWFFAAQKPQVVTVELNNQGIKFGSVFFPYKQLKYFWVVSNQNHKTLNFHTSTYINNVIILELMDEDPEQVRTFLLPHLPEHHETQETAIQKISHKLKF